jgi:type VI secretion system protein VasG
VAVRLSHRYIPARQLPDKSVSLFDTACARVAVSQHATPPELEDCLRRIQALEVERDIISREAAIGIEVSERRRRVSAALDEAQTQRQALEERFAEEKAVVDRILALRATLREPDEAAPPPDREALLAELQGLQTQLVALQGDAPLILPTVDEHAVAAVVQDWTGIPMFDASTEGTTTCGDNTKGKRGQRAAYRIGLGMDSGIKGRLGA